MDRMRSSLDKLQDAVMNQLSLAHLEYSLPLVLSADASVFGVGSYLSNCWKAEDDKVIDRLVACTLRAFTEAGLRWKTIDEQKAFAMVWIVMYFWGTTIANVKGPALSRYWGEPLSASVVQNLGVVVRR